MQPCQVPWCCALAKQAAASCAVHLRLPKLRLEEGRPVLNGGNPDCRWCNGTGDCA